jgi:hypothetical protein
MFGLLSVRPLNHWIIFVYPSALPFSFGRGPTLHLVLLQPIAESLFSQLVLAPLFVSGQVLYFSHKPSI